MKKVFFVILFLIGLINLSWADGLDIKYGYGFYGKANLSASISGIDLGSIEGSGSDNSIYLSAEGDYEILDNLFIGGGGEIILPTEDLSFASLYPLIKLSVGDNGFRFYTTAKCGYNKFMLDSSLKGTAKTGNGIFWGINAGCLFNNIISVDLNYSQNRGSLTSSEAKANLTYTRYSITVGYHIPF